MGKIILTIHEKNTKSAFINNNAVAEKKVMILRMMY
jgi:hypothetical protein